MKKRVLVTGGTKSDVAPIAVFLMNAIETNGHLFDKYIVFHDGVSNRDKKIIESLGPVELIKYECPIKSRNGVVVNYFSTMLFSKYECLRLLNDYSCVCWSDYDVILKKNLDEIFKFDEDTYINITTGTNIKIKDKLYAHMITDEIEKYDLEAQGISAALMVFNDKLPNYQEICNWCYEKTMQYDRALLLAEEAILSLAFQKFNLKFNMLESNIYAVHPKDANGKESIIHAVGTPKFWNGLNNSYWDEKYKIWLSMGGSKYNDRAKKLNHYYRLAKSKLLGIKDSGNLVSNTK